jgi:hypothetical protein
MLRFLRDAALLLLVSPVAAAITLDGRLDEPEWSQAARIGELVTVSPLTGDVPPYDTDVRVHSDERGLFFGIRVEQPASERRTRQRTARDAQARADRVNLLLDLDGRGVTAYEFTITISGGIQDAIVTNQRSFAYDWDGLWHHAVHEEDDHWSVEVHLPWTVAPMGPIVDGRRRIGVYVSRVLEGRGQRYSFPGYDFEHPTFITDMARIEIAAWQRPALDLIPYASVDIDRLRDREELRSGVDVFWKPTGRQQLSLALRPDFGQVESDDLVVDFSAIETFFSEKRPFFTENQSLFTLPTTSGGQLLNTRRIGAAPDAGPEGSSDIDLAVKYSIATERSEWGVLVAREDDSTLAEGRDFHALRGRWRGERSGIGYLGTVVQRPTLQREATVHALDGQWYPLAGLSLRAQAIATEVDQQANAFNRETVVDQRGAGGWLRADYAPGPRLLQRLELSRYDRDYQINDLGYMRRNDLVEFFSTTSLYTRRYPDASRLQSSQWQLEALVRENLDGERIGASAYIGRSLRLRDTTAIDAYLVLRAPFVDDLITRGNGKVTLPARHEARLRAETPRLGRWRVSGYLRYLEEGVGGGAREVLLEPILYLSEDFTSSLRLTRLDSSDWLIWRGGDRLASFEREQFTAFWNLNWFPAARHEVRLRAQYIGLRAAARRSFVAEAGRLRELPLSTPDFALGTLGLQLRYRYEFGPQRELFLVYSRGGANEVEDAIDDRLPGFGSLFDETRARVTADQVIAKLRWRF